MAPQIRPMSTFTGSAWVEPALPLEPRTIELSAIDNLCAHVYPTPTFFWRLQPGDDPLTHFAHLRTGLSRLLYQQPHLAGILRQNQRGAFSVEIPAAPHAGSRLIYRDVSDDETFPTFEQLEAAGFPFADGNLDGLAQFRPDPFPASEDGDPVIVQQLTNVRGGLILTSSYTHLVGDLVQGNNLGPAWAKNTRAVAEAALAGSDEATLPEPWASNLLDRSSLIPEESRPLTVQALTEQVAAKLPDWAVLDPSEPEKMVKLVSGMHPPAYIPEADKHIEDQLRMTRSGIWRFTSSNLDELKKIATAASPPGTKVTTIDALSAFIWQRFLMAKYILSPAVAEDFQEFLKALPEETHIIFAGDTRRRFAKPLPQGYMGVCVDLFRAHLRSCELLPRLGKERRGVGLAKGCAAIRYANNHWSEAKWDAFLELSWRAPFSPGLVPKGPIDLLMTDHTRGQAMAIEDWGPGLGMPVAFREPYFGRTCPAGEVTMLPRKLNGDVEVMISGETVVMQRLKEDEGMQGFSQNVFLMHNVREDLMVKKFGKARL